MAMHVQITDHNDHQVILRAGGGYNPDVLDDLVARATVLYRESIRIADGDEPPADPGEEVPA